MGNRSTPLKSLNSTATRNNVLPNISWTRQLHDKSHQQHKSNNIPKSTPLSNVSEGGKKSSLCEMNKCSSRLRSKPDTTKNLIKGKGQSSAALVFPFHPLLMGYRPLQLNSSSSSSTSTSTSTSITKTGCNPTLPLEQSIGKPLNCSHSSLSSPSSQSVNLSPVNSSPEYLPTLPIRTDSLWSNIEEEALLKSAPFSGRNSEGDITGNSAAGTGRLVP